MLTILLMACAHTAPQPPDAELLVLIAPLNHAAAVAMAPRLVPCLSAAGSVRADPATNQVILRDTEARLAEQRQALRYLDAPGGLSGAATCEDPTAR